jgi:hypothetical protein
MENEAFTSWFDDMELRYQASYGSYEELFKEAFEAGAKQEREACAKLCDAAHPNTLPAMLGMQIRARGDA